MSSLCDSILGNSIDWITEWLGKWFCFSFGSDSHLGHAERTSMKYVTGEWKIQQPQMDIYDLEVYNFVRSQQYDYTDVHLWHIKDDSWYVNHKDNLIPSCGHASIGLIHAMGLISYFSHVTSFKATLKEVHIVATLQFPITTNDCGPKKHFTSSISTNKSKLITYR